MEDILLSDSDMNCLSISSNDFCCGADGCCRFGWDCRCWKLPRGRWLCSRVGAGRVRLMERLIFPLSSPMTLTLTVWPSVSYSCRSLT